MPSLHCLMCFVIFGLFTLFASSHQEALKASQKGKPMFGFLSRRRKKMN